MGIVIFVIALVWEVVFTTYCITSKDAHNKARSWVRIGVLAASIGLALTPIVDWGFRWYFLAALLALLAGIGGVRLTTKKFGKKPYKKRRSIAQGIVMVLLVTIATIPALVFPQYESPAITGAYTVETVTYTYTDTSRIETFADHGENRKLTVKYWYPKEGEGPYPLIVFSHGAFGVKMSNASTCMELASNGYVVGSIDHPYHAAGTIDAEGNLTTGSREFMQEVIDANSDIYSEKEQFELFSKWMDLRTDDFNFVLDTILENAENKSAEVYARIDTKKIGLMGHSLGGAASVQLGRERDDIGAVINLDGSMLGEYSINGKGEIKISDEPYALPLLNFYSEYVLTELKTQPEYVYPNRYLSAISPMAFEVCIRGSNHMSYTDLPLFSPLLASQLAGISGGFTRAKVDPYYCIETMNTLVLEFFNSYIKGEGTFVAREFY